uniref:(northern house mosquito) hypothetical protein n=1 Tax=Culex pipiens TaxID=7175 RepID=A0A8D8CS07_CULPI
MPSDGSMFNDSQRYLKRTRKKQQLQQRNRLPQGRQSEPVSYWTVLKSTRKPTRRIRRTHLRRSDQRTPVRAWNNSTTFLGRTSLASTPEAACTCRKPTCCPR